MDLSSALFFCTQAGWRAPSCKSELYTISSPEPISPPHCADLSPDSLSFPIPPTPCSWGARSTFSPSSCEDSGSSRDGPSRMRSRNPTRQRRSASEKEKLRMRGLTKALHHLRTYLPASVAPTGQTLTKIETLRLAIRYISYLSSQLDVPEQPLGRRTEIQSPADLTGLSHYSTAPDSWRCSAFPETPYPAHGAQGHHGVLASSGFLESVVSLLLKLRL
uniref:BHLH domain-containing protein n=1 Tax=Electrophorus electricus TaxID=8005 RepID=A0A4W4GQQ9_ELEEL